MELVAEAFGGGQLTASRPQRELAQFSHARFRNCCLWGSENNIFELSNRKFWHSSGILDAVQLDA
jgi:hypothetical protein